jgi:hypothetical protein
MTRKYPQTRSLSERSTDLDDLYDYARPQPPRHARKRKAENTIIVTDDWLEIVPITEAELRVIEAHFGDFLDEVPGPRA